MKKVVIAVLFVLIVAGVAFSQAKPGGIARQAAMGGGQAGSGLVLNPFIMDDPALLFINPAYQSVYKDYLWSNIGGGSLSGLSTFNNGYGLQNAGVGFAINDQLTVGTILSYDPSADALVPSIMGPISWRSLQSIPPINNVWEVLGSFHVNSMNIGLAFTYGWSNIDTSWENRYSYTLYSPIRRDTTESLSHESEASANMFGFRAGMNYDLGNGSSLDFSGAIRFDNATDTKSAVPTDTTFNSFYRHGGEYSASATEMEFTARAKMKVSSKFNFVPYGMLAIVSGEPKEDKKIPLRANETQWQAKFPETDNFEINGSAFAVGIGGEFRTQSFYLAGGISWQSMQVKEEYKYKYSYRDWSGGLGYYDTVNYNRTTTYESGYTAVPVINLGAEWSVTDWLTCRLGYYRAIGSAKYTSDDKRVYQAIHDSTKNGTYTYHRELNVSSNNSSVIVGGLNPSTFDGIVTLGVGLKFGGFAFDATISDEALRRGLGLIGASDAINTFGYITASYNFAE